MKMLINRLIIISILIGMTLSQSYPQDCKMLPHMPPAALNAMMGKYSKNLTPKNLAKMKKDQMNQKDFTKKCYMDDGMALIFALFPYSPQ